MRMNLLCKASALIVFGLKALKRRRSHCLESGGHQGCPRRRLLREQTVGHPQETYEMKSLIAVRSRIPVVAVIAVLLTQTIAQADVVLDWNAIMQSTVSGQAPFPQARFAAITQLAVFEAVNAIQKDYQPYLGTITAPSEASAEAAAVAAAHAVLKSYFPASAALLDSARASSLAVIPNGASKDAGISVGERVAAAVLSSRSTDGSAPPQFYVPTTHRPGDWAATPGCTAAGGAFFHWKDLKPFVLQTADQFRLDEPPGLNSARYGRDYQEVKSVGGSNSALRPQDRSDVARFYAVVSPVAVWNPIARQLSVTAAHSMSQNARTFALLNMALSDAAVSVFDTKYRHNSWRPETAIRMGHTDDNDRTDVDPTFTPLIIAPCFPGYPSAHAGLSGAAREVLEQIYAPRRRSLILSNPAVPGITLRYRRLKEITDDIDDARVFGGIHFRFDQEDGADLGRRVGEYVLRRSLSLARSCGCESR